MGSSYIIGSFNACNLSFNSSKEKLEHIADIIKSEVFDFDIVGVQEVLSEGKAWGGSSVESEINERFLKYNLPGWDCKYCKPTKENSRTSDNRGEGFFLLWKKKSFHLAEYKKIGDKEAKTFEPRIINELSDDRDTPKELTQMARMPMYARLVANNNSSIEFRIINVHIFEGGKGQEGFKGRQEEFWTIINDIYSGVQGKSYGSGVKPYTIVLGDYNLILNDELAYRAEILEKYSPYIETISVNDDGNHIITRQTDPTSLRDPIVDENGEEKMPDEPYKNNYDHFSYDLDRFNSANVQVDIRRIDMEECISKTPKKYNTKRLEYRKNVSDHVPVIMKISF